MNAFSAMRLGCVNVRGMDTAAGLDSLLEPLSLCLDAESARRLVAFRVDQPMQARIEMLGERANEGNLNASERSEYEALINAADFIAILKLKARRHLDQIPH
ncbi:MAG: hypothetical protein ABSE86_03955 [Bryobacteraceae bacterium]